ncbi:hypothetical protein [Mycobacterium lepromatosis]|uniref:hypothetical protein n=1 Tax=Mycobacterium lepromatosis TaxID=480418 RepID=UPI0005F7BA7B|nr:hypothetical protein [Mycobacterium lepromatosis]
MLALLIAVLPFGFAVTVFSEHPDLFTGIALARFAVTLASAKIDRSILFSSAPHTVTVAVLTLVHKAIPLLCSLDTVLSTVTLAVHSSINIQRLSAPLTVAPGLAVTVTTALLGAPWNFAQLCAMVTHGAVD